PLRLLTKTIRVAKSKPHRFRSTNTGTARRFWVFTTATQKRRKACRYCSRNYSARIGAQANTPIFTPATATTYQKKTVKASSWCNMPHLPLVMLTRPDLAIWQHVEPLQSRITQIMVNGAGQSSHPICWLQKGKRHDD